MINFKDLYCIVDFHTCNLYGLDVLKFAEFFVGKGVPFIQYRDKRNIDDFNSGDAMSVRKSVWDIRQATWGGGTKFIVNDFVEMALEADADGVHLGQEDIVKFGDAKDIKKKILGSWNQDRIGKDFMLGISTHSEEQARSACETDADYIGVGPLLATPTKENYAPLGIELAKEMISFSDKPTVLIGGIGYNDLEKMKFETGADFVAMVRGCAEIYTKYN